jgi:hypothetical protein
MNWYTKYCLTSVILATQEAEIRRSEVNVSLGKKSGRSHLKQQLDVVSNICHPQSARRVNRRILAGGGDAIPYSRNT